MAGRPPKHPLQQQSSPLLRLPGELRNKIYKYAIGREAIRVKCQRWIEKRFLRIKEAALSLTCKQIRSEIGAYLPYSVNTFSGCDKCLVDPVHPALQPGLQYVGEVEMQPLDHKVGKDMIRRVEVLKNLKFLKHVIIVMPGRVTEEVKNNFLVQVRQTFEGGRQTTQAVTFTVKAGS